MQYRVNNSAESDLQDMNLCNEKVLLGKQASESLVSELQPVEEKENV
jgi:hypothetical protein